MTASRLCACGCKADLDALGKRRHARCASGACRARLSTAKRAAPESAEKAQTAPARRNPKPSGLQVSYRRAVDAVAHAFGGPEWDDARTAAEAVLCPALSDAQRARLNEREPAR